MLIINKLYKNIKNTGEKCGEMHCIRRCFQLPWDVIDNRYDVLPLRHRYMENCIIYWIL